MEKPSMAMRDFMADRLLEPLMLQHIGRRAARIDHADTLNPVIAGIHRLGVIDEPDLHEVVHRWAANWRARTLIPRAAGSLKLGFIKLDPSRRHDIPRKRRGAASEQNQWNYPSHAASISLLGAMHKYLASD